jgi:hypothetical protein
MPAALSLVNFAQSAGSTRNLTLEEADMGVTGWPRSLAWTEFLEISSRPAGVTENAQVHVTTDLPSSGIRIVRDGTSLKIPDISVPLRVISGRDDSWVVSGTKTDDLLSHEQGHFDIAGLVAWELYRAILAIRASSGAEMQRLLNEAVARAGSKLERLSGSDTVTGKYDTETNHALNATEQKRWKDLIRDCMTHDNRALPDP